MEITFKKITIENFKNVEHLQTEFGSKTFIYGANETGKTTFADAISYVLTGKSSLGESQFQITPINKIGVSPKVELDIEIDSGKEKKTAALTRMYQAKMNKAKEYTGEYQTVCFINGLKVGPKEFEKWVNEHICSPEIFRLIHDVRYFTENIATSGRERPWEAQRRLLFSICNIKPDKTLAGSKKKFESLCKGLSQYDDVATYLAYLKSIEKVYTREIEQRNDKLEVIEPVNTDVDVEALKAEYDKLYELYIKAIVNERAVITEVNNRARKISDLKRDLKNLDFDISNQNVLIETNDQDIENLQTTPITTKCLACGQELPKGQIQQANINRQTSLKQKKERREVLVSEFNMLKAKREKTAKRLDELEKQNADNGVEIEESSGQYIDKLATLKLQIAETEKRNTSGSMIERLEVEIKALSNNRAKCNQMIDLCNEFVDTKCKMASKKINDMFDGVHFELFSKNKTNGEIRPACDIFWHDTPYESLSYSTKFIVSMKIALAFQRFYGVEMPLIVDNAESIDFPNDFGIQAIFLTKRDELCSCGGATGRKEADGMWTCKQCGNRFHKKLEIVTAE